MTNLQAAKQLLKKVKQARQTSSYAELVLMGSLVEAGAEDPLTVTIEVDSIGPKYITGYVREFGFVSKFVASEDIQFRAIIE